MGQIAEDMIDGTCCSFCGQYFQDPDGKDSCYTHGYPVVCKECWNEIMRKPGTKRRGLQKAAVNLMGVLIACLLFVSGCGTTIRYNPDTGEVYYHSDTGKEFSDLSIIKEANGDILIEVNKYKGEGVGPIVGAAVEGVVRGMKP